MWNLIELWKVGKLLMSRENRESYHCSIVNLWYKNKVTKAQNHSWKVIMNMWKMRSHGRVGREVRKYSKRSAVAKGTINMLMSYKQVWRDWMILWKKSSAREMETVVFFYALQSFYSSILIKFPRITILICKMSPW